MSKRNWKDVDSTAIASVRKDGTKTKLEFRDGTTYSYNDKNDRMYNDMVGSGSKGGKFNAKYRQKRTGTKTNKRK